MVEKENFCQVHGSTLQSSMVISKPQPSVLHLFGETSSFEVLMSFKLKKHFVTLLLHICHNISYQCILTITKFSASPWKQWNLLQIFFTPAWPIKSTQELPMYIATLMTIDVHSTKPPCSILSSILWFFLQCWKGHASFCGCSQAKQGYHLWGAKVIPLDICIIMMAGCYFE